MSDEKPQDTVFDNVDEMIAHLKAVTDGLHTIDARHAEALRKVRAAHGKQMQQILNERENRTDWIIERREAEIDFLKGVIGELCLRIERTQQQLRRDNQMCVYSEPLDIMNLLGRETDAARVIQRAREKQRRNPAHKARELELAKRTGIWPVARIKEGSNPPVRVCACGQEWLVNSVPSRHNGLECQPEVCQTQFNGGPCAGIKGHSGDCTPNADDIPVQEPLCTVEGCGHPEDRHTRELPEEGYREYCTECVQNEYHSFRS